MNVVSIFKALADPTRLKILDCIKNGEKCICEIIPFTGKSQPNVSQHIKILEHAGLVKVHKKGTNIFLQPSNATIYTIISQAKHFKMRNITTR